MSNLLNKAVVVAVPFDVGANEFGVLRIDSDTDHKATELPASWSGSLVGFRSFTNNVMMGLSESEAAEVSTAAGQSGAGVSAKAGMTCVAGTLYAAVLPTWGRNRKMYLIHEAAGADTLLEMWAMRLPSLG